MNSNTMKFGAFVAGALASLSMFATTITLDRVAQRWPWNNKVDIGYTITDGEDVSAGRYYRAVFTAKVNGVDYVIDGASIGAPTASGSHIVTWNPPEGLKIRDESCTLTPALYTSDAPSGKDYMIVDLDTGAITYEGLFASKDASNARYNTRTYKTSKMAFRRIGADMHRVTGEPGDGSHASYDFAKEWPDGGDFYMGIFPVTQAQYVKMGLANPSVCTSGENAELRPVENMKWIDLHGSRAGEVMPHEAIEPDPEGTFLQRLLAKTGVRGFDLPTEIMSEIAARAGDHYMYAPAHGPEWWSELPTYNVGNTTEGTNNGNNSLPVGSLLPNGWGLYDVQGNVHEWVLDQNNAKALHDPKYFPDWKTPYFEAVTQYNHRMRGGSYKHHNTDSDKFRASCRSESLSRGAADGDLGFRVSFIPQ